MDNLSDDIIKYKKGLLSAKEMHALEKKALDDPFLAEALQGSEAISSKEFLKDVEALNSKIISKRRIIFTPLRIAAGFLLLATSVFLVYQLAPKHETLALKNETSKPQNQKPEEIKNQEKKIAEVQKKDQPTIEPQKEIAKQNSSGNEDKKIALTKAEKIKSEGEVVAQNEIVSKTEVEEAKPKPEAIEAKKAEVVAAPIVVLQPSQDLASAERKDDKKREARSFSYTVEGAKAKQIVAQTISGIVVSSENGSALPGVNVTIKGTAIGTVTDASGSFTLTSTEENPVLNFSFIGLQSKEVSVQGQNSLVVKLENDDAQLSEVVVTGQGISRETKALNYSVSDRQGKDGTKKTIFGIVLSSENNSALPGVNVLIKGTAIGTVTNASGRFSITTDQNNPVLGFYFIGYQTKEVDTKGMDSVVVKLRPR